MRNITRKAFYYALCIMNCALIAACTSDDEGTNFYNDPDAVKVNVTVGSPLMTRSNPTGTKDEQKTFNETDIITISDGTKTLDYKYNSNGSWSAYEAPQYLTWGDVTWGASGSSSVTFKAFYPANQMNQLGNTYQVGYISQHQYQCIYTSDYMTGEKTYTAATPDRTIEIEMERKMALVKVVISGYNDQYPETGEGVTISNMQIYSRYQSTAQTDESPFAVTAYTAEKNKTYYAIVVPNRVSDIGGDQKFITFDVTYNDKTEHLSVTVSGGIPEFTAGNMYTYNLTVGKNTVKIGSVSVKEWGTGEIPGGTTIQLIGEKTASEAAVGDYYMSDGSLVGGSKTLTEEQKTACIGVVFCTEAKRIGDAEKKALKEAGVDTPHGLVMAKKNASTGGTWGPSNNDISELTNITTVSAAYADFNGLANSQAIWNGSYTLSDYPAFEAAKNYGNTVAAPSCTTGWFLPSIGQWWDFVIKIGGMTELDNYKNNSTDDRVIIRETTKMRDNFNNKMSAMSGDQIGDYAGFWASSEVSNTNASIVSVGYSTSNEDNKYAGISPSSKDTNNYVRCVLAF